MHCSIKIKYFSTHKIQWPQALLNNYGVINYRDGEVSRQNLVFVLVPVAGVLRTDDGVIVQHPKLELVLSIAGAEAG